MNHAILWTQNLAELFLGNDGDFSCVKQAYRDSDCVDSFAFDKKWNATNNTADAYYYVLAFSSYDDNFAYEDIYVTVGVPEYSSASKTFASDSMIHQQQIKKYIQQEH